VELSAFDQQAALNPHGATCTGILGISQE